MYSILAVHAGIQLRVEFSAMAPDVVRIVEPHAHPGPGAGGAGRDAVGSGNAQGRAGQGGESMLSRIGNRYISGGSPTSMGR